MGLFASGIEVSFDICSGACGALSGVILGGVILGGVILGGVILGGVILGHILDKAKHFILYGVVTISRLLKIIGLFCRIMSLL